MNISVLGCGRWGSFIAYYLSKKHKVTLWGRKGGESISRLKESRKNEYLVLPESVKLTEELSEALDSEIVIISIYL